MPGVTSARAQLGAPVPDNEDPIHGPIQGSNTRIQYEDPKNDPITVSICQASVPRTTNARVLVSNVLIPAQIAPRYKNDETSLNVVERPCSTLRFFATNGLRGGFHRWLNFRSARWLGFRSAPTRAPVSRGLQHSVGSHLLGAGAVLASESLGLTRLGLSSYRPTFLEETHHGSIPQRLPALGPALGPTPTSSSVTRRF